ncbi:Protein BZZ1 [Coemansia guatemalensis]|uniref:Protein BZZ1 n=1 Tax=Coemansia guatemalensis TaxID=2761395 RepID=A0A9W8HY96_9FUNG|nr:Protein BZZ1 [Coemansia guatemalensis]
MTFGSELKPNEFGAVNGYVERQLDIYSGLSKLLTEKAVAERDYGRRLVELARGFQEQLGTTYEPKEGSGIGSLALTDTEAADNGPLELLPAANEWALRLEEEGRLHVQLGSKIGGDIAESLKQGLGRLSDGRQRSLEFYQRLLAERDHVYEQKDKARAQYEARTKALVGSQQRQERATTEKDQDKYRQKSEREVSQRNHAKNEYILQVAVANEVKRAVNHTFTPRIMDAVQRIDQQRVETVRRLLLQMLNMQDAATARLTEGTRRATHVLTRVAPEVDSAQYVRRRIDSGQSKWDEPPDFRIVVDVAAGEDENMMLDGESQVILRNLCVHAQREGVRAEQEARSAAQAASQQQQQQKQDEEGRGIERALEAERESTLAELELVQHRALRAAVEQRLGPVDQGSPHEFKSHTVAISKTCDYCGDSIGGLNRKSARCTLCEYTCHAKCQIKVEPNCPGPDPEAKSGFLSLFGSKRGRKKSHLHQRSASVVSADSAASHDSTHRPPLPPQLQSQSQSQLQPHSPYNGGGSGSRSRSSSASTAQPSLPPRQGSHSATLPRMSMQLPPAHLSEAATAPVAAEQLQMPGTAGRASTAPGSALAAAAALNRSTGALRSPSPLKQTQAPVLAPPKDDEGSIVGVLYDFEGDGSTTLTVHSGDRVQVVDVDSDGCGWTEVVLLESSGPGAQPQQGMVPTSYLDMSAYRTPAATRTSTMSSQPQPQSQQQTQQHPASSGGQETVVARFDFVGRSTEELSFKAGDRIRVLSREIGDGWLLGELDGCEGRLPTSYVADEHIDEH